MTVVDASSVVNYLVDGRRSHLAPVFAANRPVLAPELIYLEVGQSLRGLLRHGLISDELARNSLRNLIELRLETYRHPALLEVAWDYRHNLTIYDATYLALTELIGERLVTADACLASVASRALGGDRVHHVAS